MCEVVGGEVLPSQQLEWAKKRNKLAIRNGKDFAVWCVISEQLAAVMNISKRERYYSRKVAP